MCRKRPSGTLGGSASVDNCWFMARIVRVSSVGMGSLSFSAIWSKPARSSMDTVNFSSREVWGTIEAASEGEDKLTSIGTDFDRRRYASSSSKDPPTLRHTWGKESSATRHCRQTAVALITSRCFGKNVAVRAKVSGGILFMGAKVFLMLLAFLNAAEIFKIASSIYIRLTSAACQT